MQYSISNKKYHIQNMTWQDSVTDGGSAPLSDLQQVQICNIQVQTKNITQQTCNIQVQTRERVSFYWQ